MQNSSGRKRNLSWHVIGWTAFAVISFACALLAYGQNVVELAPGLKWWKIRQGLSMITWNGKGVVAKGDLYVIFCDDGIEVPCESRCIYIDLLRNEVTRSDNVDRRRYLDSHDSPYRRYGIDTALGTYPNADWSSAFKNERQQLLERVARLKTGRTLE